MVARIGVALVLVALLAMAPIDAGATMHTYASTIDDSLGLDPTDLTHYHYDGTSVSDTWDDSNAADIRHSTAFADYGVLRIAGVITMLGDEFSSGGRASASAEWVDNVVVTNASLTGQSGIATVVLSVTGSLVEPIGSTSFAEIFVQKITADGGWWNWRMVQSDPVGTVADHVFGTFSIDIPIVFGERFDLQVHTRGGTELFGSSGMTGTASFDMGNSLYWGGITKVVDSNGTVVAYSMTSESGHDWTTSSVPGATVPGDNTSSSSVGSCSVAPGRGSDALSGAVAFLTLLSPMAWLWAVRRRERRNR